MPEDVVQTIYSFLDRTAHWLQERMRYLTIGDWEGSAELEIDQAYYHVSVNNQHQVLALSAKYDGRELIFRNKRLILCVEIYVNCGVEYKVWDTDDIWGAFQEALAHQLEQVEKYEKKYPGQAQTAAVNALKQGIVIDEEAPMPDDYNKIPRWGDFKRLFEK